mmetsp:Transcript_62929/g.202913  ORF Transcript_62929/g.202913 Transcript_62929/m.202913 type:complete len:203 (+) Transcript_62929:634-1242(+)
MVSRSRGRGHHCGHRVVLAFRAAESLALVDLPLPREASAPRRLRAPPRGLALQSGGRAARQRRACGASSAGAAGAALAGGARVPRDCRDVAGPVVAWPYAGLADVLLPAALPALLQLLRCLGSHLGRGARAQLPGAGLAEAPQLCAGLRPLRPALAGPRGSRVAAAASGRLHGAGVQQDLRRAISIPMFPVGPACAGACWPL